MKKTTKQRSIHTSVKHLALSELHAASSYLERLFQAALNLSDVGLDPEMTRTCKKLALETLDFLDDQIFLKNLIHKDQTKWSTYEAKELTDSVNQILESLLKMPTQPIAIVETTVDLINLFYRHSNEIHSILMTSTDLEIQYPRINLIEMHYADDELEDWPEEKGIEDIQTNSVPRFYLPLDALTEMIDAEDEADITSLDWQRDRKYEKLLQEGHEAIFNKDNQIALDIFTKAKGLKETAEILTLLGWVHGLLKDNELAKTYCLKAIKKDPDYGPPYNDLGSYLLAEGQTNESLKWFELAKKSPNYENREYPYINSGRAFLAKKDYNKALDEFHKALGLAPYHQELHNTVKRLKRSLVKDGRLPTSTVFPTEGPAH